MMKYHSFFVLLSLISGTSQGAYRETLIFKDEFDTLDLQTWKHDLTLGNTNYHEMYGIIV